MNAPMTREQLLSMAVHSADLMADLVQKEVQAKRLGPWNHSEEGRKRRKMRRNRIRAKAAWLYE